MKHLSYFFSTKKGDLVLGGDWGPNSAHAFENVEIAPN